MKKENVYGAGTVEDMVKKVKSLNINMSGCRQKLLKEPDMIYDNLNDYQKKAYSEINELFNKSSNKVVVIDAPSGSGKTFLLRTLAANYHKKVFIVFRKDQASEISSKNISAYTYMSFNMHYFQLSYRQAICMFSMSSNDSIKKLYKLLIYSKKFMVTDMNKTIMIVDTYTIPSPAMLLLLYIVSLNNNMNLIFAGSTMQLNAIDNSALHGANNFYIVQILNDLFVKRLGKNMRAYDTVLSDKISHFHQELKQYKPNDHIALQFNLRYTLYKLFQEKYFTEERFDTVFIAQTHKEITARLYRFVAYLNSINKPYVQAPFYFKKEGQLFSLPVVRMGKFFPYLLLVEGYKYIHVNSNGFHKVVTLEKILYKDGHPTTLHVRSSNNDECVMVISQCVLNHYQILPAYRTWLLINVGRNLELLQFPLRPYTLTYHAALGRTIEEENVELSLDCTYANFAYIGLSCVREYSAIYKIHTPRDLPSYAVTYYMENKKGDNIYYYRCPSNDPASNQILEYVYDRGSIEAIDNIEWTDVDDVKTFEQKKINSYLRIPRCMYKPLNKQEDTTPLMQIAQFVKDNPNVIRDTIKMIPVDDFSDSNKNNNNNNNSGNKKKNKKRNKQEEQQQYAEPRALIYLRNKYAEWINANKEY
ncbi:hypothetical protein ANTQUA_LOCUS8972 [Anthophora quadrimaculata]